MRKLDFLNIINVTSPFPSLSDYTPIIAQSKARTRINSKTEFSK